MRFTKDHEWISVDGDIATVGITAYAAELRAHADHLEERASAAVHKAALDTMRDAKILAPVDTGNLRNSITTRFSPLRAEVVATADYAVFVELGTTRMAEQPFMRPAAARRAPGFIKAIEQLADGS